MLVKIIFWCIVWLAFFLCWAGLSVKYKKMQAAEKEYLKMAEILRGKQAEFDRARIASARRGGK